MRDSHHRANNWHKEANSSVSMNFKWTDVCDAMIFEATFFHYYLDLNGGGSG